MGKNEYQKTKEFGKTAQVMLNDLFIEEGRLKQRMKSNVRATMTTSVGWIKMSFQESLRGDPIILRRANDVQDNLRRIEYLIACAKKDTVRTSWARTGLNSREAETVINSPEMKIFKASRWTAVKTEGHFPYWTSRSSNLRILYSR